MEIDAKEKEKGRKTVRIEIADTQEQLEKIYNLYMEAFPASERKPFALMVEKSREGQMEILSLEGEEQTFLGLGIVVLYGDLVLLDYFAVSPEHRESGIGTEAFRLLKERYPQKRFFLEIESTIGEQEELELKKRRKRFYLRNDMTEMSYLVLLFGVEMEILTDGCSVSFEEYFQLYKQVFGKRIENNVSFYKDLTGGDYEKRTFGKSFGIYSS